MIPVLKIKSLHVIICLFMISCATRSQDNRIDEFMTGLMDADKISGAAIAVTQDGKLLFSRNYGFADLENKTAISDSTRFNIMSISKIFIACSIVRLADKKVIGLDDPIKKYFDNLPSVYDHVLIYQLLNHSAGVPDYVHVNGYMAHANRSQTPWQVLAPIMDKPLDFFPGEKNAYSNSGYFLLGLLIEKVTGTSLGNYLKATFFQPLGMKNTFLDSSLVHPTSRAKGYTPVNGRLKPEIILDPSQYWAAGGIVSTKKDMLIWDEALKKGLVLPQHEINQMIKPSVLSNGSTGDYGLGFELMNVPNLRVIGNNGVGMGFNAANMNFPDDGLTILVLTNTSNGNSTMISKDIHDIIMNNNGKDATVPVRDKLDSLVMTVFRDVMQDKINQQYFKDSNSMDNFKKTSYGFIKSHGTLVDLNMQGEKINPESIVRRYTIKFQKDEAMWVIIFNKEGKIILTNHM